MAPSATPKKTSYHLFKEKLDELIEGFFSKSQNIDAYFLDLKDMYFETLVCRKLKAAGYLIVRLEQESLAKGKWFERQMPSLFQEKQVFVLKKTKTPQLEDFLSFQSHMKSLYPVVFFIDHDLGKLTKKLTPRHCYLSAPKLKTYETAYAISDLAKELRLDLQEDLTRYLAESAISLSMIETQLQKLTFFDEFKNKKISYDMASRYMNVLPSEEVFQIDRLMLEQKQLEASNLIFRLLKDGESPLSILGVMGRYFRLCLHVHSLKHAFSAEQISSQLSLPGFVVQSYLKASRHISPASCKAALKKCAAFDEIFKSRSLCPQLFLEEILDENRI